MKSWALLAAIEILMPGGSLIALGIYLYRRFFANRPTASAGR
ncbi:MAG TPA: hypothetical protein VL280_10445 [Burkholderiales bacterium]|nr:hypothetical protein [Burkholderiales bacterium]